MEIKFISEVLSFLNLLRQRTFWKVRATGKCNLGQNLQNPMYEQYRGNGEQWLVQVFPKFTNYKFVLLKVRTTRKHMKTFSIKIIMFIIVKAMGRCIT